MKLSLLFVLFVVRGFLADAQDRIVRGAQIEILQPKLKIDSFLGIDNKHHYHAGAYLGTYLNGEPARYTFILRNSGTTPLQLQRAWIQNFSERGGSDSVRLTKRTLRPRDTIHLTAHLQTEVGWGGVDHVLHIVSNATNKMDEADEHFRFGYGYRLLVNPKIIGPRFEFEHTFFDIGEVPEGPHAAHTFFFKNTGNAPILIKKANTADGGFTVDEWSKNPILPGQRGYIKVSQSTMGRVGPFDRTANIFSNAAPGEHQLRFKGKVTKR